MIQPWMVIGGVTLLVGGIIGSINPPKGLQWFKRLRRPDWLTFEKLIPIIWTTVFVCAAWSATIVWQANPGTSRTWFLMGTYLALEIITLSFNPIMLFSRSLRAGAIIGATGAFLAALLAVLVWQVSGWAVLLLVPYLIWSPIGTYTTWEMARLNPADA